MDVGGTRMNDYAYYECVDGFRLEGGSTTKRCNKDEEWEGEDPVCVGGWQGETRGYVLAVNE